MSIKTLTNHYNNLRSQRLSAERHVEEMKWREQEAANRLAHEEARQAGIVVGGEAILFPWGSPTKVKVVQITGFGPGCIKYGVVSPRADGTYGKKIRVYRGEDVGPIDRLEEGRDNG